MVALVAVATGFVAGLYFLGKFAYERYRAVETERQQVAMPLMEYLRQPPGT